MSLFDLVVVLVMLLIEALHPLPYFPIILVGVLIVCRLLVGERFVLGRRP